MKHVKARNCILMEMSLLTFLIRNPSEFSSSRPFEFAAFLADEKATSMGGLSSPAPDNDTSMGVKLRSMIDLKKGVMIHVELSSHDLLTLQFICHNR